MRAPVRRDRVDELRMELERIGRPDDARNPFRACFGRLSGLHFARLLLLEDVVDPDGELIPASLLLTSEVDSPLERHLDELVEAGAPVIDTAFGLCEGYPAAPSPAGRRAFLERHRLASQARYANTVGRTRDQVRREEQLRQAIEGFLDARRGELPAEPAPARAAVQRFVRDEPALAWAESRSPAPPLAWRARELAHALGVATALLLAAPLLLAPAAAWMLALRYREARDAAPHRRPDPEHARRLGAIEDYAAQNQFSAIGFVKPGLLRRATVPVVLWLIDYAARHVYNRGSLAGVKSIHFARWTVLDEGRRAIFTSYYDGSLESYMDDFIDKVAFGLNASFSHGVGYPRTRFLFFEGAKREEEFKDYLRIHQIPTQAWYSAYDQLSAPNIANNALIRSGLLGPMGDADAAAWLRRL